MERKFRITVDGRQYIVTVEDLSESGDLIAPAPGGRPVPTAPVTAPAAYMQPAAGPGDELSPLAGMVHSVDVEVGQTVQEGDKVASLDAMKMITPVVAHRAGKVTQIHVKPGDTVETGERLLSIA
jgi:biotin carboxyl carrier protein